MNRFSKHFCFALAACIALACSADLLAQGKGGGKPPKDDPPAAVVEYETTWLGSFGGTRSIALAINDSGVVVGTANDLTETPRAFMVVPEVDQGSLVYWRDTAPQDGVNDLMINLDSVMPVPAGWRANVAADINDNGVVTGTLISTDGMRHAFVYDPGNDSLVDMTPLTTLAIPTGVNNNGDVTGYQDDANGDAFGFLYIDGQTFDLGGNVPLPAAVNNSNQIVGDAGDVGLRYTYSYDAQTQNLNVVLDASVSSVGGVWSMNDAGSFVGGTPASGFTTKAIRYLDGLGYQILASKAGATALNSFGDVAGDFTGGQNDGRLFLYTDDHGILLLDDLVVGSGAAEWFDRPFLRAWGMNDFDPYSAGFGQICGHGQIGTGEVNAFVLTPQPVQ